MAVKCLRAYNEDSTVICGSFSALCLDISLLVYGCPASVELQWSAPRSTIFEYGLYAIPLCFRACMGTGEGW